MKKSLTTIILIFCVLSITHAQNNINGIGQLTLGSSKEVIKQIGYTGNPVTVNNTRDYINKIYEKYTGTVYYKIVPNEDVELTPPRASYNPEVEIIYLPSYEITSTLKVKGVYLSYYNDVLYDIYINDSGDLPENLTLKYGNPKLEYTTEEKEYTNPSGKTETKTNETYESKWETGIPNIICYNILGVRHNSKGEKYYVNYFNLYHAGLSNSVYESEKEYEEDAKERANQRKIRELNAL